MTISSIAATSGVTYPASSSPSSAAATPPTVDYTEFLQLLVAELQNQDPTSPTDPTQYMSSAGIIFLGRATSANELDA